MLILTKTILELTQTPPTPSLAHNTNRRDDQILKLYSIASFATAVSSPEIYLGAQYASLWRPSIKIARMQ